MSIKTWDNGENAGVVRKIIEENFKCSTKYLNRNVICLSTEERLLLGSDYLSNGLIIYDTTKNSYYKYDASKRQWEEKSMGKSYVRKFIASDWIGNSINIPFELHEIPEPIVQMYIIHNDSYEVVVGGIEIDENSNVILSSDMPFDGKVVIK